MHTANWGAARTLAPLTLIACLLGACVSNDPIVAPGELYTEEEKAAMSTEEKVAVYNEQVEDPDRLICKREARTGSHRHKTVCRTIAEIKQESDRAREDMDEFKKHQHGLPPVDGR